jgi:hypothetical protein
MSNNIEGKIVVITGASGGLGDEPLGFSPRRAQASCWVRGATIASRH